MKYKCEECNYETSKSSNYKKHIDTVSHSTQLIANKFIDNN